MKGLCGAPGRAGRTGLGNARGVVVAVAGKVRERGGGCPSPAGRRRRGRGGVVTGLGVEQPGRVVGRGEMLALSLHLRAGHSGGEVVDEAGIVFGNNARMAGPDAGLAIPVDVVE